jgi:hypothetical protein
MTRQTRLLVRLIRVVPRMFAAQPERGFCVRPVNPAQQCKSVAENLQPLCAVNERVSTRLTAAASAIGAAGELPHAAVAKRNRRVLARSIKNVVLGTAWNRLRRVYEFLLARSVAAIAMRMTTPVPASTAICMVSRMALVRVTNRRRPLGTAPVTPDLRVYG